MATMPGWPKKLSMRRLSLTEQLAEQLKSPVSWTLLVWSPLTTPMSSHLEDTLPEETLFLVKMHGDNSIRAVLI